jgi:hypothetical protein
LKSSIIGGDSTQRCATEPPPGTHRILKRASRSMK